MACDPFEVYKLFVWPTYSSSLSPLLHNVVYIEQKTCRHVRRPERKEKRGFKFEEMTRKESPDDRQTLRRALGDRHRRQSGQEPQQEPDVNTFYDL